MGKGQTTKRLSNKISPRRMQVTNKAIYNDKIPQKTKKKKKGQEPCNKSEQSSGWTQAPLKGCEL